MNSRLLVRRQNIHVRVPKVLRQTRETTVDDIWQIAVSQMLATRNFGDWHTVVGEVLSLVVEAPELVRAEDNDVCHSNSTLIETPSGVIKVGVTR